MNKRLALLFTLVLGTTNVAYAETTLVYQLGDAHGATKEQTYTLHGRWVRVDDTDKSNHDYLILDTGFQIMHVVDAQNQTFTTFGESHFHQGKQTQTASENANAKRAAERASKHPAFKPTGMKDTVAGIRCNIVNEIVNDKPVAEHCMADTAVLGMNQREMITMTRFIMFSKDWTDPDWIAEQSNEQFVSIRSRPTGGEATFQLKTVTHAIPPNDYFRVPPSYRKMETADDYSGLITGKK